ncbi:hypothetical protein LCGC14_3104020, partial [marine sediment metagenome]
MGFQIEDATGTGTGARVDHDNRLQVASVATTSDQHINEHNE